MQPEEITAYIVEELAEYRHPQDIVLALCEKTKMSWSDAEKLVEQVQSDHGREIAVLQNPVPIILSVGLLVIGFGVTVLTLLGVIDLGLGNKSSFLVLFLGVGMILGGITGLWNADTKKERKDKVTRVVAGVGIAALLTLIGVAVVVLIRGIKIADFILLLLPFWFVLPLWALIYSKAKGYGGWNKLGGRIFVVGDGGGAFGLIFSLFLIWFLPFIALLALMETFQSAGRTR